MDGTEPQTRELIDEAREELKELEERLSVLRGLLDRAVEREAAEAAAPAGKRGSRRFARKGDSQAAIARSVASHMSLDGYSREHAEERLRGTVSRRELRRILDEVYGRRSAAVRNR